MVKCYYCKKEIVDEKELVYATQPWLNSKPCHENCFDKVKVELSKLKGPGMKIYEKDILKNCISPILILVLVPTLFYLMIIMPKFPEVGSFTVPIRIMLFVCLLLECTWAVVHIIDMQKFRKQLKGLKK